LGHPQNSHRRTAGWRKLRFADYQEPIPGVEAESADALLSLWAGPVSKLLNAVPPGGRSPPDEQRPR